MAKSTQKTKKELKRIVADFSRIEKSYQEEMRKKDVLIAKLRKENVRNYNNSQS